MSSSAELFQNVLLVEDDSSHALLIERALKDFVSTVTHAADLPSALAQIPALQPDLIITDLHMPGTAGALGAHRLDHVRKFLAVPGSPPVIVLTSSTSLDDAVEAMRVGARDFIVKNFEGDFKAVIGMSLSRLTAALLLEQEKLRLQRETAALRTAIESSKDAFGIIDAQGSVVYCNRSFTAFLDYCGGSGEGVWRIFAPRLERQASVREAFERSLQTSTLGTVFHTELTFADAKGVAFDLSLSGISQSEGESHPMQSVVWIKDISDQKRREKFQREILSTTTHDLKGPLGAILISTELLTDNLAAPEASKQRELVLRIASSAQGAVNLIDEFLSARRIQEGNFVLRPSAQDINALVEESVETNRPVALSRKINLHFEPSRDDMRATVDRMGVIRVVGNLLSNALKFTPKGGAVTVRTFGDSDEIHIQVIDTGSGLEPSEVQRIFERFGRLDKHQGISGTGIGLFVVKSIVTAHGGKVEVSSKVGSGSTFDIALPRQAPVNEHGELYCLDFVG